MALDFSAALDGGLGGQYQVDRLLGTGGMGSVYAARDLKHRRAVAIKVLRSERALLSGSERFLREINVTANLQHPHILPLLDSGTVAIQGVEVPYYVMPLLTGQSLRSELDSARRLPLTRTFSIARDVAQALDFAHRRGVIHRDIKPENILLDESGAAVVADFGIARALQDDDAHPSITETGGATSVGTPVYMSPEQAFGDAAVGPASDQYSLASVVFEMLTGQAPYSAATKEALLARRLVEPIPRVTGVAVDLPPGLDEVLTRALARKPSERFARVEDFVTALEEAAAGAGDQVAPVSGQRRLGRHRPGRRWGGPMLATAGIVTVAISAGLVVRGRGSKAPAEPAVVAVAGFENLSRDSLLDPVGRVTADWITQGIAETGIARIIASRTTAQEEARRGATSPFGSTRAREVAKVLRATKLVTGSYRVIGDSLEFTAQVVDVGSGHVDRAIAPTRGPRADVSLTAQLVRERVLGALASALDRSDRGVLMGRATGAPKYEAYRRYLKALELQYRYRNGDAGATALSAYQLDTSFVQPLFIVVHSYSVQGRNGGADSMLDILERHAATMSPVDRAFTRWQRAQLDGDYGASIAAGRELDELSPSDDVKLLTAYSEFQLNRVEAARKVIEPVLANPLNGTTRDNVEFWEISAAIYHRLGRYQEALAVVRRGRTALPTSLTLLQTEIFQLGALGRRADLDTAISVIQQFPEVEDATTAAAVFGVIACELRRHGQAEEAKRVALRGLEWLDRIAPMDTSSYRGPMRLVLLVELDRWTEVLALADTLRQQRPLDLYYSGSHAVALAHLGRKDEAAHEATKILEGAYGDPGEREFAVARITAARGLPDEAISWVQRAIGRGFSTAQFNFHVEKELDVLHERPEFEALTRPRG